MKGFITTIMISCVLLACKPGEHSSKRSLVGKEFTTESGLKYMILKEGTGVRAKEGDEVAVHYTGKLTNDSVFDSSIPRGNPIKFVLGKGQVIKGWDEGIALLNVGDSAVFTIPPALAYGEKGVGPIPGNATLIFEVELVGVIEPPKPYDVAKKDTVKLPSGLNYILVKENKEGRQAAKGNTVSVHYSGYLEDGNMFDSSVRRGEPLEFKLGEGRVIKGWDEGIAVLRTGEKARFVIPPVLGYGERGYPPVIPANATLIFDVELINIAE